MLRKNIAPVVATILTGLLFIIIGSCFSAFLYKDEIVKVMNPRLLTSSNIKIYDAEGDKETTVLKFSKMKQGLKPATGEEDTETNIPITITDKQGSEGHYGKIKVLAPEGAKIFVKNIQINSKEKDEEIDKERENLMIAIKEIKESTKSLKEESVSLGSLAASNEKVELTFYVWLSNKASDILEASSISFDISFETIK